MPERGLPKFREIAPPKDQEAAVLNNTLLIDGKPAAPVILERFADFPIRRIVVFGEPGANKTTLLLQLATAVTQQDAKAKPKFIFYDSVLAKFRQETGVTQLTTSDHHHVSHLLTTEMESTFKPKTEDDGSYQVQFVELVGMSLHDRGVTTLTQAAKRLADTSPIEKDTLAIGIVADPRSLRDAGQVRQEIRDLVDPTDVYEILRKHKIYISLFDQIASDAQIAQRIVDFFKNMAPPHKIKEVHGEVMTQARRRATEDDFRLFKQLRLPNLTFPITDGPTKTDYLLSLSFMQTYMGELGLVANALNPQLDHIKDVGITIFSPYNPDLPKVLDLSKVL